jgi:hypothetical protein
MASGTLLKLPHKIDVYTKSTTISVAGQRTVVYTKAATIKAFFQPINSERRVSPYIDNIDEYQFFISYKDSSYISYENRIQNIVDRSGSVIYSAPLEIINIVKQPGITGKINYIQVMARVVVENA